MSILQEKLKSIDEEARLKKQSIIDEHIKELNSNIEEINDQIIPLNEKIDGIQEAINILEQSIYESKKEKEKLIDMHKKYHEEIQSLCTHELIKTKYINKFVSNRISYAFNCQKCGITLRNSGEFVIVKFIDKTL